MPPLPSLLLLAALALQLGTGPERDGAAAAPLPALHQVPEEPAWAVERMPRVRGQKGLWMGGVPLCRDSVASAVATTVLMGAPAVQIAFRPAMRAAVARETGLYSGRQMPVRLDGRALAAPFVETPILRGVVQMIVGYPRDARRIAAAARRGCLGASAGAMAALEAADPGGRQPPPRSP